MKNTASVAISKKQREDLLKTLQSRFEKNVNRHPGIAWAKVQAQLEAKADKLQSLHEMERTGGEPDVVPERTPKPLLRPSRARREKRK